MGLLGKLFGSGPKTPSAGETPEFQALIQRSLDHLDRQNRHLAEQVGIGGADRWDLDASAEKMVFTFADKIVEAPVQIAGSFDSRSETWQWAWSNASIPRALALHAEYVRAFGKEKGIARLTERKWPATEEQAWEMAALANHLNGTEGVYRGPSGTVQIFFTLGKPETLQLA